MSTPARASSRTRSGCSPSIPTSGRRYAPTRRGSRWRRSTRPSATSRSPPFTARILTSEVEYRDITFPAGSVVLVSAWHANRDGIDGADEFDIAASRAGARVLTFGAGIHYCVGANLARLEMQEGLAFLAERVRTIELDGEPEFGTPSGIYGLERLPLVLTRA